MSELWISWGWAKDKLSATVMDEDENKLLYEVVSLERLCLEPAECWHNKNGYTDAEHYVYISRIARRLREQADRIDAVASQLKVKEVD